MDSVGSKIKHGAHVMLVSGLVGANIATIVLMWASCLTTFLSPVEHPRISQGGLLFPIFLALNLLFLVAWLIVHWKWVVLPVVGILGCWGFVRDYIPVNVFKDGVSGKGYKVISFNVAGFANDSVNGFDGWASKEYIAKSNADLIFLQEYPSGTRISNDLEKEMKSQGYYVKSRGGLCIYSKWPFIGEAIHQIENVQTNGSYAWLLNIDGDTAFVINNHLQSNAISPEEKQIYGEAIEDYDRDKMKSSGKLLLSRLSKAASKRAEQTQTVCELIKKHERYSTIVAGDMNDTPVSYTYQQISSLLDNAFECSGNGLGISYNRKGFPVRIDHIFVSKDFLTDSTYIDKKIRSSDHRPIVTRVYKSAK